MPFTERAYYPLVAGGAGAGTGPASLPAFQFRGRHESPDWRRLSAVDVGRVSREGDVAVLQEYLEHVTFCNAERERCPHCQGPSDPLLLKLLRLAQLCTEYLLHSQEYLSAQLSSLEDALRVAQGQRDQLGKEVAQHLQEIKGLKEECRRRKKIISTQQMMLEARASYHQCQFCEKAFMSYSFLQSHLQRRHPEECQIEQKRKAKTDKLQDEIDKLKEQLQITKSQLEAEQQANMIRFSKECEQQKSKEEILQTFHKWKEEEKEKLADEIEKVKEMFMKELKELSSRNSTLENQLLELQKSNMQQKSNLGTLKDSHDFTEEKPQSPQDYHNVIKLLENQESNWTSRIQALCHDHETEKSLLKSEIEKLKSSMRENLNKNNAFYQKRIEELVQEIQKKDDMIITQQKKINEFSTKSIPSIKSRDVSTTVEHLESSKPSMPVMHEIEKSDLKPGRSNHYLINALKTDPSLTKELRVVLAQALEEKLESLGIKAGVRGIPNDRLNEVLGVIESTREHKQKQDPNIHRIRELLERQVSQRAQEKLSSNRPVSYPQLPSEKQNFTQAGISSSATPRKPVKRSSTAVRPAEQRTAILNSTSTPKSRKLFGNGASRKTSSITTPPFSSEEEDEDDIKQLCLSPELPQKQSKTSSNKVSAFQKASGKSDANGMEQSETEGTRTPAKTSKGTVIQQLTEQVGESLSNHGSKNKPAGGINVAQAFIKKEEVKELKLTEVDEDDWDISSVEDDLLLRKDARGQKAPAVQKKDANAASVVHAWGLPKKSVPKEEGLHETDNTNTLKSSLVTVTDWSDSSDI
ncbi:cilium assembly protein DZIP1 isoform X1 [Colius striatus]|uniref:cilium assembly protein DZIP1 isoform X1 n=1 Tax=Colius striatus TaxID=57412 RepID=UPI002B1D6FA8|nr:cilium assembly protein DZIP1 isoform X1 [Colius striatus]XP_061876513.1 cilium assembly protein DZIP1 isoform X1 [Colius striatus]XP_061876514.1 cilium assembly protein DZIP1 isoform X1 [Colius striatus]XP_061876515.1 cilium assembly protein DZIP1 isoform X1 [Colius striatus]